MKVRAGAGGKNRGEGRRPNEESLASKLSLLFPPTLLRWRNKIPPAPLQRARDNFLVKLEPGAATTKTKERIYTTNEPQKIKARPRPNFIEDDTFR